MENLSCTNDETDEFPRPTQSASRPWDYGFFFNKLLAKGWPKVHSCPVCVTDLLLGLRNETNRPSNPNRLIQILKGEVHFLTVIQLLVQFLFSRKFIMKSRLIIWELHMSFDQTVPRNESHLSVLHHVCHLLTFSFLYHFASSPSPVETWIYSPSEQR